MFAGIITHVGSVVGVEGTPRQHGGGTLADRLRIDLGPLADGLTLGASVAVNGACLTLTERAGTIGEFDVVPETWGRTTLRLLRVGDRVNLECSLRVGDPVDGHFVQGHVEGVGAVERVERGQGEWKLWMQTAAELMPAITPKGSIAIDGTSLTVVDVEADRFSVALVPTTLERTVLGRRRPGDRVNIETDILARIVLRRLATLGGTPASSPELSGVSWDKLRDEGFLA
jgi:riboflavin synthase